MEAPIESYVSGPDGPVEDLEGCFFHFGGQHAQ